MNSNSHINIINKKLYGSAYQRLIYKYCRCKMVYDVNCINNLIYNESSRVVAMFKDFLIVSDYTEFLRRFYMKEESKGRLKRIVDFYETYSKIFPNYMVLPESVYLYKNIRRKQKMIDAVNEIKKEEEENRKQIEKNNNNNANRNGNNNVYGNVYSNKKKQMNVCNNNNNNNNVFTDKIRQSINNYHPSFSVSRIDNNNSFENNYTHYINFTNNINLKSNNKHINTHNNNNEISISLHLSKLKKIPFDTSADFNVNLEPNPNETNISIIDMLQILTPSSTNKPISNRHTKSKPKNNPSSKRKKTPNKHKHHPTNPIPSSNLKKPTTSHLHIHKSKKNIYLSNIDNPLHSNRFHPSSTSSSINKVHLPLKKQNTVNKYINLNNNYHHSQTVSNDTLTSKSKSKHFTTINSARTTTNHPLHKPTSHTTTPSTTSTCFTIANKPQSKSPLHRSSNKGNTIHNATISSAAKQRSRPIINVNPSTSLTKTPKPPLKHTKSLGTHFTSVSLLRNDSQYTTRSLLSPRHKGNDDEKKLSTALRCKYKAFVQRMKVNVGKRNGEGMFSNNSVTIGSGCSYRGSWVDRKGLTTLGSSSSGRNINLRKSITKEMLRKGGIGKEGMNGNGNVSGHEGRNGNEGNWKGSSFEMQVPKLKRITVNRKGYTKREVKK